ncbi:matrix metalloproteinase-18-like [Diabrotica virgifera virgifera]|uniref:Peptidase metallopeptidase domain-containing protein n=1 Tax=Diabrotica virgifera virgifera TaxID=50390 RepID=A0ABM5JSV7_DIAVI|nr:matrix metalloproteinase-18-like [Diabrotica virgifera virgifera]XP_050501028.1 matrix metalloproteinase-18-like [Diabrotica virgifera virgifera]XP_050503711.1 matrix metalloproteinase-18-like [Diabrotica virgifera virgifera]XP_050507984.1 matrix metalloproteinase-18-like [Diabrotica virgifera virgifera]
MEVFLICVLLLRFIAATDAFSEDDAMTFLQRYGYIDNNSIADFNTTLLHFQEQYNLYVDGTLNDETIALMQKPRCQTGENDYSLKGKWYKHNLRWYFPQANHVKDIIQLVERAFKMWEDASNLHFTRVTVPVPKPDITITAVKRKHYFRSNCMGNQKCGIQFDGPGGKLAHSYFPIDNDTCVEIHLDLDEKWSYNLNDTDYDFTNLFMVILHEIGHSLGLLHSNDESAIMYPWYPNKVRNISQDDISGLEALYGRKSTDAYIPTQTSAPTRSTSHISRVHTTRSRPRPNEIIPQQSTKATPHFCAIEYPNILFLAYDPQFKNHHMYIIHEGFVWKNDLNGHMVPNNPEHLSTYLPKQIRNISHVFQNIAGNLIVASNNTIYSVSFPSITISRDIPLFVLPPHAEINVVFQTHTGKTYIWYDNTSFIEYDDLIDLVISRGLIKDIFPGVPTTVKSVFKYTDGHLYFLDGSTYYKYNEFTKKIIEIGRFNWNLFGIPCPDDGLVTQLKYLLNKVGSSYK